jgi:hypothetical protein
MRMLSWRRPPHAGPGLPGAGPDDAAETAVAGSVGPGWYDSSWDLRRGLIVREGLPADATLHEWLEHQSRADGPAP